MKQLIGIFLLGLCIVAIYFDLTAGTIPKKFLKDPAVETAAVPDYKEVMVKRGDTVLSVIERMNGFPDVPLEQVILDFSSLNNGMSPEQIEPGKVYKFPLYHSLAEE